jgi:hypothetical protein
MSDDLFTYLNRLPNFTSSLNWYQPSSTSFPNTTYLLLSPSVTSTLLGDSNSIEPKSHVWPVVKEATWVIDPVFENEGLVCHYNGVSLDFHEWNLFTNNNIRQHFVKRHDQNEKDIHSWEWSDSLGTGLGSMATSFPSTTNLILGCLVDLLNTITSLWNALLM